MDGSVAHPARLALGPDQLPANVDDQVIALIDPERYEHRIAGADEEVDDRALGAMPDINGVIRLERGRKARAK
jgi:hypothetical protein